MNILLERIVNKQIKNHTFQDGQTGIVKWWRWGESNPCPNCAAHSSVYSLFC